MNKIIQTLLVLTLFACSSDKQTNHGESEKTTPLQSENEEAKKVVQAETTTEDLNPQVAVDFINSYVDNAEKMGDRIEIREWTRNSELVTDYFKTELDKMITEAYEREPEYGLGFDPILDAQDYPDGGFKLLNFDETTGLTTVNGKEGESFHINIQLVSQNGRTLVDGCGVVNLPEELRAAR